MQPVRRRIEAGVYAQAQPVDATRVLLLNGSYLRVLATTAWSVPVSHPSDV